jgi:hypothetical protein
MVICVNYLRTWSDGVLVCVLVFGSPASAVMWALPVQTLACQVSVVLRYALEGRFCAMHYFSSVVVH